MKFYLLTIQEKGEVQLKRPTEKVHSVLKKKPSQQQLVEINTSHFILRVTMLKKIFKKLSLDRTFYLLYSRFFFGILLPNVFNVATKKEIRN